MFPSQSARYPGMLEKALSFYPQARPLVESASRQVERDLFSASHEYRDNRDVQLAGFVTNHVYLSYLESRGWRADISLGASLGELNHIVHIGALSFEQALDLVARRGDCYSAGPEGERAVLFPMGLSQARSLLEGTSVEISGHLAPGVVLVGGDSEPLRAFVGSLQGVTSRYLGVRLPIHSSHFHSVSVAFREVLRHVPFSTPTRPYLPNATGRLLSSASVEEIKELLARQVSEPMWWRECVDEAIKARPGAIVLEVGPGRTLSKLFEASPAWHPGLEVQSAEALAEAEAGTHAGLSSKEP